MLPCQLCGDVVHYIINTIERTLAKKRGLFRFCALQFLVLRFQNMNLFKMKERLYLLIICAVFSLSASSQAAGEEQVFDNYKALVAAAKKEIQLISIDEFHKMYTQALNADSTNFTLIDIRTEAEYGNGFIPGAFWVQRGVLELRLENDEVWEAFNYPKPKKSDLIILYCGGGGRSALATKSLKKLGYTNVKSLDGGWSEWSEKYPNSKKIE